MERTAVWGLALAASWGAATGPVLAEDQPMPTSACTAAATRVAAAVGGKVGPAEGDGYRLAVPAGSSAYYGCAEGAVGLSIDGVGASLSVPVAKLIGAAAIAIAGQRDPALQRGAAACIQSANLIPKHGNAGLATARRMNHKKSGEVMVGGLHFVCTYSTDGSELPTFFVGQVR